MADETITRDELASALQIWRASGDGTFLSQPESAARRLFSIAAAWRLPPVAAIRRYMRETGWDEGVHGSAGSVFAKGAAKIGVPHEDDDQVAVRGALTRLAASEMRSPAEVARDILAAREPT
jgi:hypothetical protein